MDGEYKIVGQGGVIKVCNNMQYWTSLFLDYPILIKDSPLLGNSRIGFGLV